MLCSDLHRGNLHPDRTKLGDVVTGNRSTEFSTELQSQEPSAEDRAAHLEGSLHDVANALTVVLGWLESAQELAPAGGALERAVRLARERGQHGRAIALRAMQGNGCTPEHAMTCDAFVQDAITGVEPQAKREGVTLGYVVDEGARRRGVASPSRALQVVTNLLMNAVSFTPVGASVTLEVHDDGSSRLRFVVRDQGRGFDSEQACRVFDGLDSTRQGGCGIGLRYAHRVAREQGGDLRLVHAGPGAEFELRWPSEDVQVVRPTMTSSEGLEGMRVLIIEDDTAVSLMLETALEAKGVKVDTAFDEGGIAALLLNGSYDAALVDLSPLEPDVAGALARIRGSRAHPKLVLITGSAASPERAVLDQASAWVRKPFEIRDVVAALLDLPR